MELSVSSMIVSSLQNLVSPGIKTHSFDSSQSQHQQNPQSSPYFNLKLYIVNNGLTVNQCIGRLDRIIIRINVRKYRG